MQGPRMQQTMPEDRSGWHHIDAGPHLEVLFHPDRRLAGRDDQIERPSIVIAVAGKREQALRFDPFSMGAHYHIREGVHNLTLVDWQSYMEFADKVFGRAR